MRNAGQALHTAPIPLVPRSGRAPARSTLPCGTGRTEMGGTVSQALRRAEGRPVGLCTPLGSPTAWRPTSRARPARLASSRYASRGEPGGRPPGLSIPVVSVMNPSLPGHRATRARAHSCCSMHPCRPARSPIANSAGNRPHNDAAPRSARPLPAPTRTRHAHRHGDAVHEHPPPPDLVNTAR